MRDPRRSLALSLPPLWLIGVCLFLPTVRACETIESPARLLWQGRPPMALLLSPYFLAAPLLVVAVIALARRRVTPRLLRAASAFALVAASSAAVLATLGFDERGLAALWWRGFAAIALGGGVALLVCARRREPWTRLVRAYAAYTIFTLPMAALLARIVINDGPHHVGVGAWAFLAAFGTLAAVHARSLLASTA